MFLTLRVKEVALIRGKRRLSCDFGEPIALYEGKLTLPLESGKYAGTKSTVDSAA